MWVFRGLFWMLVTNIFNESLPMLNAPNQCFTCNLFSLKEIFLSKNRAHILSFPISCQAECTVNNQPQMSRFSHARLKSLKGLLDASVASSCLCWELFGFLPEFPSGRKWGLICPQQEQEVAFIAADWNGKWASDPPPKRLSHEREMKFQLSAPIRIKKFLEKNCLCKLIKEK